MHSKKCTVKKYWQMLKYCFCTMIGSCTSCLYMRIEIHSCCPAFSPFPLPKEVEKVPENRLSSPLWKPTIFSSHLRLPALKCHNTEVAITVRAEEEKIIIKTFSYDSTGPTWAMCSLRCRRWSIHSQASRRRGRPCPCRPSAAAWGCKTPWALHCSGSWPSSRLETGLAASQGTSAPVSCSRPGDEMQQLGFRITTDLALSTTTTTTTNNNNNTTVTKCKLPQSLHFL